MKTIVTLLILFTLFLPSTASPKTTRNGVCPKVPKHALVKGGYLVILRILRTALVSRSLVVSVFGSTIRRPIKKSPC